MSDIYMPMGLTAEVVAERYKVTREAQDEFALASQQRTAAAQKAGKFDDEIVPMKVTMEVTDKATGEKSKKEVDGRRGRVQPSRHDDRGAREAAAGVQRGRHRHGRQLLAVLRRRRRPSLIMSADRAKALGIEPLGFFRGCVFAGCEPDEMGIGPVFAVPKLLKRHGLKIDDIDIVELNEAFASQAVYCRDKLGIDPAKLNPNGGAISIGHPYGMTGARCTGHAALELRRQKKRWGIVTMCVGGGMGAAGLFEAA